VGKGSVFQVALPALVQSTTPDDHQTAPEATLQAT
jgi:hypothetical protein